jgi:cytochrome c5
MNFPGTRLGLLTFGIALAGATGAAGAADGKAVYEKTCVVCHAAGVANAPKLGDKAAWAPRVATGKDALLKSVVTGKGAMPPKAGNADLKDDDIKAAIDYMLASVK